MLQQIIKAILLQLLLLPVLFVTVYFSSACRANPLIITIILLVISLTISAMALQFSKASNKDGYIMVFRLVTLLLIVFNVMAFLAK